jgi:gliding motility-associated-like protein
MNMDAEGNIIITGKAKEKKIGLIEHAPYSFYGAENILITSKLKLENKNHIRFELGEYSKNETITIDPWTSPITSLGVLNIAYDVDYDNLGNLYAYITGAQEGDNFVSKYSPTGVLLWTHNVVFTPSGTFDGNFLVEKLTGSTYISKGDFFGTYLYRIATSGISDGFVTTPSVFPDDGREFWNIAFNCSTNSTLIFGGSISSNFNAGVLNTTTGTIIPKNFTGIPYTGIGNGGGFAQDVVAYAINNQGEVFVVLASEIGTPSINNHLVKPNLVLTSSLYDVATGFNTFIEASNHIGISGLPTYSGNQFNGLSVNESFLIYYDGLNLKAFNPNTGVSIVNITIPGHFDRRQGGVAIDDCNNIYIGGNNGNVLYYSFDGTTFTLLGSIDLGWTTANKNVHDIVFDKTNNLLYISGRGNVAVIIAPASINCSLVTTVASCTSPGIATTTLNSTLPNPVVTYTWTDSLGVVVSQTTNSTSLTNTINGLNSGTYYVSIQLNAPCGQVFNGSVDVLCSSCVAVTTDVQVACNNLTWIDGITYTTNTNSPTFTITGGSANGCDSIIILNLIVNPIEIDTDVQIACNSLIWIDGNTYTASTTIPTFTLAGGTTLGCDSVVNLNLTINPSTTNFINKTICQGESIFLGGLFQSKSGIYIDTVFGGNSLGCDSLIITNLTVSGNTKSSVIIPNVFSPNLDGNNDIFKATGSSMTIISTNIYNRWGELLFESFGNIGWDGRTTAGEAVSEGTYFYVIKVESDDCGVKEVEIYKGTFALMR